MTKKATNNRVISRTSAVRPCDRMATDNVIRSMVAKSAITALTRMHWPKRSPMRFDSLSQDTPARVAAFFFAGRAEATQAVEVDFHAGEKHQKNDAEIGEDTDQEIVPRDQI